MLPSSIFLLGFLLGALAVLAAQAAAVVYVIIRLKRRAKQYDAKASSQAQSRSSRSVSDHHSLDPSSSSYRKKGAVWVLEPEKLPKAWLADKVPGQQKQKKEIFEVSPVHKYAEIKDDSIILTEADGSHTEIQLKGCTVVAVSASSLSSRKWTKHVEIDVHFVREQVECGEVEIRYVPTSDQVADILTKGLPRDQFAFLCKKLGLIMPPTTSTETGLKVCVEASEAELKTTKAAATSTEFLSSTEFGLKGSVEASNYWM